MKKKLIACLAAVSAAVIIMSSCVTANGPISTGTASAPTTSGAGQTASTILGSLLDGLIGNAVPVTEKSIVGTWVYQAPEVRFESESLLTQAGGEIAAASIEQKLSEVYAKLGVVPGTSGFIFKDDKTCTIALGANGINGTYTVDPKTNTINISATGGLIKLTGKVYFGVNSLVILFDAKKILTIAQTIGAVTGQSSSTIGALSSALSNYNGLMLGMNLKKQ